MSDEVGLGAESALVDLLERLRGAPAFVLESDPSASVRTAGEIIKAVERVSGVTHIDFISARRWKSYCEARQIAYWFMRHFTAMSYPQIGWACGQRHHTTVIHGVKAVNARAEYFRSRVEAVAARLKVRLPDGAFSKLCTVHGLTV